MNCKFHPTAEAVTTCAICGAGMCSSCENGAFFHTDDDKPICLECSLKEAEDDLSTYKPYQKALLVNGIIASIIWIIGACLTSVTGGFSILIMLCAVIFFYAKVMDIPTLLASEEKSFFGKIGEILFGIVLDIILLPLIFILLLIKNKWDMIKANKKLKKIKAALGTAN